MTTSLDRVISLDGTPIAYQRQGRGPAVILVGGGLLDPATGRAGRAENEPLARELARAFTVFNYDRRGRAESGDTPPYAVERELEDLGALLAAAGGSAHLYGLSSGGALALEAAAAGLAVESIAVYDVPYSVGDDALARWRDYLAQLHAALASGRRGDAIELFLRVAGSPDDMAAAARQSPLWPALEAIAHTLAYDAACLGDDGPPAPRLARIAQPVLVVTGGGVELFDRASDAVAAALPRAAQHSLGGQAHTVDAKVLAPVLARFFTAHAPR